MTRRKASPCHLLHVKKNFNKISYHAKKQSTYHALFFSKAPRVGLEPTTPRLTAVCSTIELSRNIQLSVPILILIPLEQNLLYNHLPNFARGNLIKCIFFLNFFK